MALDWPAASEPSVISSQLRVFPEDFDVTEHLSFELSNDGEHLFLYVEKKGANTAWIAKQLAKKFGVKEHAVGYAGLKDRHAITRQWFSVHIPGQQSPDSVEGDDEFSVLTIARNNKKLKTGAISHNEFKIVLRNVEGNQSAIEQHLEKIRSDGYPNYFGAQRFGHGAKNIEKAIAMLQGNLRVKKHQKSIYLSALRSWYFNQFLAERIKNNCWLTMQSEDRLSLEGSRSHFAFDASDNELPSRLASGDIHIAAPMPGCDFKESYPQVYKNCEAIWQLYLSELELIPAKTEWRSMRVLPKELCWQWLNDTDLQLHFSLDSGSYATGLLAELGAFTDVTEVKRNVE